MQVKNRKGSIQDIPAQTVLLFKLGVTLVSTFLVYDKLMGFSFFANSVAMKKAGTALSLLDYGMVTLVVGFFTASIFFASRIRTSKIFLPLSFLFLFISAWVSAIFSNVWKVLIESSVFSGVAASVPFASKVLVNLPLLMFVGGSLVIVALYSRIGGGQRATR